MMLQFIVYIELMKEACREPGRDFPPVCVFFSDEKTEAEGIWGLHQVFLAT